MRKRENKAKKPEKSMISLKKILVISIVFIILMGMMGVMATNVQVKNVKIILSSGYEMNVMTTNTKIADILKENNIILLDGESVTPDENEELSDNKTITITKGEKLTATPESYFSEEEILESYKAMVEKVVTVQEEIPFETITKDVSGNSEAKQDKVVQNGVNGIKEVTYRVRYQSGNEIDKEKLSETIIKEKVDKIVEVRTKQVTSRSNVSRQVVSGSVAEYQKYAYEKCMEYGWSESDYNCLVSLWNKESGWNPNAENKSSGAYGIPQNNNSSKRESWYRNDAYAQIDWGINYIKNRYSNPTNAWSHSVRTNWY